MWWVELLFINTLSFHLASIGGIYVHSEVAGHRWDKTLEALHVAACSFPLLPPPWDAHAQPGLLPSKENKSLDHLTSSWSSNGWKSLAKFGRASSRQVNSINIYWPFSFCFVLLSFESFYWVPVGKKGKGICGSVWYI